MKLIFARIMLIVLFGGAFLPPQVHDFWVKIPALAKHYRFHLAQHPDTNFFKFLDQHYGEGAESHSDDHDHSDLPLKSDHHPNNHCHCAGAALLPNPFELFILSENSSYYLKISFPNDTLLPSPCGDDIFQPPRAA